MNFRVLLFPILFAILTCADTPNKPVTPKELFGWAGAPEDINKKPHDYFYAKFYGKVEILSTKLKAEDYQNKCIQSATKQAKAEILFMVLDEHPDDRQTDEVFIDSRNKPQNNFPVSLLKCKPNAYEYSGIFARIQGSNWRDCECIFYMKVPGGRDFIVAKMLSF